MRSSESLVVRSFSAIGWSYSGVAVGVVLQIAGSILFARMLGPRITGVFAFGLLVFPPFRFICEFGLGAALIDKKVLDRDDVQMAFTGSLILSILAAVAWFLCIPHLASWIREQQYVTALDGFAIVLLCLPLQTICTAILTKRLEQKYVQISSLVGYAVGYLGVGLFGALHGWGLTSLVIGFLAQNVITTLFLYLHTRMSLKLAFKASRASLWRFGSHVAAINVSNWLTGSLDNMAVAWFFGSTKLGLYSVAYGLVRTPADKIVLTLQNVLFPASALARDDNERLKKACIAIIDAVFLLTAPIFCSVAVLAPTMIEALYGRSWLEAASVLPPFALSMVLHCLIVVTSALLWGIGGVGRDLRIQWFSAAIFLIAVILAAQYSTVVVAWTTFPISALRAALGFVALVKVAKIHVLRAMRAFLSGGLVTALIMPSLFTIDVFLNRSGATALFRLAVEIASGGLLLVVLGALFRKRLLTPELRLGLESLRRAMIGAKSNA